MKIRGSLTMAAAWTLAALADSHLRATPDQLRNVVAACADLHPVYRRVKLTLDELRKIEDYLTQLDQQTAARR